MKNKALLASAAAIIMLSAFLFSPVRDVAASVVYQGMSIINSDIEGTTIGVTSPAAAKFASAGVGNLVAGGNGLGEVPWAPQGYTGGTFFGFNQNGGSTNESDFINYSSTSEGGFYWWTPPSAGLTSPIMTLSPAGELTVHGGISAGAIQGSSISSVSGGVSAFSGDLFANSFGTFTGNGSYLAYNAAGQGETDFVTQNGGTLGLYSWYFPLANGFLGSPAMTFAQSTGTLTVQFIHSVFTGNLTGDVTGNITGSSGSTTGNAATATLASTATLATAATALAGTPSQCSGVPATGIAASGNANCFPSTYKVQAMVITSGICTTASGAGGTCSFTSPDFASAFSDSSYAVSCTPFPATTSSGATNPSVNVYVSGKTNSFFSVTLQGGQGSGAGSNSTTEIDCTAVHN